MAIRLKGLKLAIEQRTVAVREALERGGMAVHADAVRAVQKGPASGTVRANGSVASAPGEAPMTDTGILAGGIVLDVEGMDVFVISRAKYSKFLEYGTKSLEPRPYMHPAYQKNEKKIMLDVRKALKDGP